MNEQKTAASPFRRPLVATAAVACLGLCVLGPWHLGRVARHERERDVRREACASMQQVAASLRDTSREAAALNRETERMFRDSAASLAVTLEEERRRGSDADADRMWLIADVIADTERRAEGQRRSAEQWDQLAAEADAERAATSEACGGSHG